MEDFVLYDENRVKIPILEGFPDNYIEKYGIPGSVKYHAYFGKFPLLFQFIQVGKYEIVCSDYLTNKSSKITCKAAAHCLELHFFLTGKVLFQLKDMGWKQLEGPAHNILALSEVKDEVHFEITPVSTFDIHISKEILIKLAAKYPKLNPLVKAIKEKNQSSLFLKLKRTNPYKLWQIIKIRAAFDAGKANEAATEEMVEKLILMVLDDEPVVTKYDYSFEEIKKIENAHRLITMYLDETGILASKITETGIPKDKFREGFRLLYNKLPGLYLQHARLEKAKKLASEGNITSLTDLATLCGYRSKTQLTATFFKYFGEKLSTIIAKAKQNSN